MTIGEQIVFLHDYLGWTFEQIAHALHYNSRQRVHQIYKTERVRFNLDEIMEYLKD